MRCGEIVTCWKLVRRFVDCCASWGTEPWSGWAVLYDINKRTYPRCGGLLAFDDLARLSAFVDQHSVVMDQAVLRGRGETMPLPRLRGCIVDDFEHVWADSAELKHASSLVLCRPRFAEWPEGTIALRWFEPEKVISCTAV